MQDMFLGYNSPTEWVFTPEIVTLYDRVTINESTFNQVMADGDGSTSRYLSLKRQLFLELKNNDILHVQQFDFPEDLLEAAIELVGRLSVERPLEFSQLLKHAFDTFILHEEEKLRTTIREGDPYREEAEAGLLRLHRKRSMISSLEFPKDEWAKEIMLKYFQEIFFVPEAHKELRVFQWGGYARFYEWFLKEIRRPVGNQVNEINEAARLRTMQALTETCIPFRSFSSEEQLSSVIDHWAQLRSIRETVSRTNNEIWEAIRSGNTGNSWVEEFEALLKLRTENLNEELKATFDDLHAFNHRKSVKIANFFISTVCSLVPGAGGLESLLKERIMPGMLVSSRAKNSTFRALINYQNALSESQLSRSPILPKTTMGNRGPLLKYWSE